MPTIHVNDIEMYYEIHGEGEPLVLIVGLGTDLSEWDGIIGWLAKKYRVFAFDNRGAGRTDKPDLPYSLEMMADDTEGLMNALAIEQAHILGISMGGRIALAFVLQHPQRVKSLILVSTYARRRQKRRWLFGFLGLVSSSPLFRSTYPSHMTHVCGNVRPRSSTSVLKDCMNYTFQRLFSTERKIRRSRMNWLKRCMQQYMHRRWCRLKEAIASFFCVNVSSFLTPWQRSWRSQWPEPLARTLCRAFHGTTSLAFCQTSSEWCLPEHEKALTVFNSFIFELSYNKSDIPKKEERVSCLAASRHTSVGDGPQCCW